MMGPEHISFTTTKLGSLLQAIHGCLCAVLVLALFQHSAIPGSQSPFHQSQTHFRSITVQVQQSQDPEGLRIFYYLVQVRRQPADNALPHTGSMQMI